MLYYLILYCIILYYIVYTNFTPSKISKANRNKASAFAPAQLRASLELSFLEGSWRFYGNLFGWFYGDFMVIVWRFCGDFCVYCDFFRFFQGGWKFKEMLWTFHE